MALLRNACFTINNYTQIEYDTLALIGASGEHRYMIVGKEKGESGTPHLQGYIALGKQMRLTTLRNKFGGRAHIERARGTPEQNREYCSKEGEFEEWGTLPKQGERTDIDKIKADLDGGAPLVAVARTAVNYQQLKFAETYSKYVTKQNFLREPPVVYWLWGSTGSGKTRRAIEICSEKPNWEEETWMSGRDLRWWQGYHGQKYVIMDEFRGDSCKFHELLRYLDRYPMEVEYKGGSTPLKAELIVITSCFRPEMTYTGIEDKTQLLRRITHIEEIRRCNGGQGGNTDTP